MNHIQIIFSELKYNTEYTVNINNTQINLQALSKKKKSTSFFFFFPGA